MRDPIARYVSDHQLGRMRLAGVVRDDSGGDRPRIEVTNPYTGAIIGSVPRASIEDVAQTLEAAHRFQTELTRHERAAILNRAASIVQERAQELAALITAESGLCLKDSLGEIGRVRDVLLFGAIEALKDDGQVFSCDLTAGGRQRRVYTQRTPLLGVIAAITPFNHPMNQVAHKVVPSIATNNRMVLKPSEKVPFSALLFADILYEAGLPGPMLSVVTGDGREIVDAMLTSPLVDLVTFTGGAAVGKSIAARAGYRRVVLELGGNDPLVVMEDADLDEASTLAVQGSYRNSGQRCTAVKRMLVHESVADRFTEQLVQKTRAWTYGDPADATMEMGTVIDEAAARLFEQRVNEAVEQGARVLAGHRRQGALYAHGAGGRFPRDGCSARRNVRARVARHPLPRRRRSDPSGERYRLRFVQFAVHEPVGLHHTVCPRPARRYGECARDPPGIG